MIQFLNGGFVASPDSDGPALVAAGWIPSPSGWWKTARVQRVVPFAAQCTGEALTRVQSFLAKQAAIVAPSAAPTSDLVIPVGAKAAADGKDFRPYQKAGVAYIAPRFKSLNADIPRAGKSVTSIGVLNLLPSVKRGLIIPPANAKISWCDRWHEWSIHDPLGIDYVEGGVNPKSPILVCNWDSLARHREYLRSVEWDFIIPDEMHRLGNPDSQRTRALLGDADHPPLRALKYWLFLSGSPIGRRPKNLWPFLRFIDPDYLGGNRWRFLKRYCDAHEDPDTGTWNTDGFSNMEELQVKMRQRFMIRREKADIGSHIPPMRETVLLPKAGLTALVRAERNAVQAGLAEFEAMVREASPESANAAMNGLANFQDPGALQDLALAALPMMIDFINEQLETEPKVTVFAHHRSVSQALRNAFPGCACIVGGMGTAQREAERVRFQTDPQCRVFVGSISSCYENLELSAADVVIFCELIPRPEMIDQVEERPWLPTKQSSIHIYRLVVDGSASADLAKLLDFVQDSIDRCTVASRLPS